MILEFSRKYVYLSQPHLRTAQNTFLPFDFRVPTPILGSYYTFIRIKLCGNTHETIPALSATAAYPRHMLIGSNAP